MAQNFLSDIKFGDNIYIRLGDGTNGDLRLYHNATHSYIDGANTGDLYIRSLSDDVVIQGADDVFIYTQGGEDAIIARGDAGVELYYNNSKKFETTNTGVSIPSGEDVTMGDTTKLIYETALQIYRDGNSAYLKALNGDINLINNDGDKIIRLNSNTAELYYNDNKKLHTTSAGATITGALSITGDGSNAATLTESSAGILTIATVDDFKVDAGSDISLDAGGNDVRFKDSGTTYGYATNEGGNLVIGAGIQDEDIVFRGDDGGSSIDALTLDMSNGGSATFLDDVDIGKNLNMISASSPTIQVKDTTNNCILKMYAQNSNAIMGTYSNHALKLFSNSTEALEFDTSQKATFAGEILVPSGDYISWGTSGATSMEGSTVSNKIQFRTGSADRMIINNTGLGVGTTSPSGSGWDESAEILHVYKNSTNGALLALESSNTKGILAAGNNKLSLFTTTDDQLRIGTSGTIALSIDTSQIPTFQNATASGTAMYIYNTTDSIADTKTLIDFRAQASDNSTFYVSGQMGSKAEGTWTSTSSTRDASLIFNTVLNGNNELALTLASDKSATFAGDLYVPNKLIHVGDTNTWIQFETDVISLRTGGTDRLTLTDSTATFTVPLVTNVTNGKWRVNTYGAMYFRNSSNATHESYIHSRSDGSLSIGRVAESDWTGSGDGAYAATTYDHVTFDTSSNATFAGQVKVTSDIFLNPDYVNANEYLYLRKHQSGDGGIIFQSKTSGGSTQSDFQIRNQGTTGDLKFYAYGLAGEALILDRENGNATFAGHVDLDSDSTKLRLGDDQDLEIYHNGSNAFIENGTGYLMLRSDTAIYLRSATGNEPYISCAKDGEVSLYYNDSLKFETTSTGATITGNVSSTTANFADNVYMLGGQLYLGASDATTNDSFRLYAASGQFVIASRESGTWTTRFDISDTGNATFAGDVTIRRNGSQTAGELLIGGTTSGGFVDFDGTSLQLNTQRDPNTGTFINTSKSHASIIMTGADADSSIKFYTTTSNNTTGTLRWTIDKNGALIKNGGTSSQFLMADGSVSTSSFNGGTVANAILLPDGGTSAPSIGNTGDTNTGMYWPADHQLGFTVNNSRKFYMSETRAFFQNLSSGVHINSTSDAPLEVESSDATTGIKFTDNNANAKLYYVGSGNYFYTDAHRLGIGDVTAPSVALHVVGTDNVSSRFVFTKDLSTDKILFGGADHDTFGAPFIGSSSAHSFTITQGGGAAITIDTSKNATFTGNVNAGTGLRMYTDGSGNGVIYNLGQDKDLYLVGDDGGSGINALVFDMSEGGAATFAGQVTIDDNDGLRIKSHTGTYHKIYHNTSTNDLAFSNAAGGDFDFENWIRVRNGAAGTVLFEIDSTSGHTGVGGGRNTSYELYVHGKGYYTGAAYASEYDLPSGGQIDWANGDARIIEGDTNNYSLSFQTYDGSACNTALRLEGNNNAYLVGKLGIGTADPDGDGYSYAEDLVIKGGNSASDGAGITIAGNGKTYGVIAFGDAADNNIGEIYYSHSDNSMNLRTNTNVALNLDSSGNAKIKGAVIVNNSSTISTTTTTGEYLTHQQNSQTMRLLGLSSSWCHILTTANYFYFDSGLRVDTGEIGTYDEDMQLNRAGTNFARGFANGIFQPHYLGGYDGVEGGSTGRRVITKGSGDNSIYFGCYDDNGYGYFENFNNSSGMYFNTAAGHFRFDTGSVIPYNDSEIYLGLDANRWICVYADGFNTSGQIDFTNGFSIKQGGSNYGRIDNWVDMQSTGFYSTTLNSAHIYPNNYSSYGSMALSGSKGSYYGMLFANISNMPHVMFDSSGNGGQYHQGSSDWATYWHVGNHCIGLAGSSTSSSYGVYVTGAIYSTADIVAYSDKRAKENIVTVDNALDKVSNLRGVYYNKKDSDEKKREVGVIAQEVKEVLPEVVTYDKENDQYGVDYGKINGLLIEAIKDLKKEIEELKQCKKCTDCDCNN